MTKFGQTGLKTKACGGRDWVVPNGWTFRQSMRVWEYESMRLNQYIVSYGSPSKYRAACFSTLFRRILLPTCSCSATSDQCRIFFTWEQKNFLIPKKLWPLGVFDVLIIDCGFNLAKVHLPFSIMIKFKIHRRLIFNTHAMISDLC